MNSTSHLVLILALLSAAAPVSVLAQQHMLEPEPGPGPGPEPATTVNLITRTNTVAMSLAPKAAQRSPAALIDDLVEVAVHRQDTLLDPKTQANEKSQNSKSALQHSIPDLININYRPARAAAQIYMGHGSSDGAANLLDQAKFRDQITVLVSTVMLDLATGLGQKQADEKSSDGTIASALERLSVLVGAQEANWAFEQLQKFERSIFTAPNSETAPTTESATQGPQTTFGSFETPAKFSLAWDVSGQEKLANQIAVKAIAHDQTVRNLKAMLGVHENPPNNFEKTLSLLAMIPEVVATAALVGDQVLEMSNGGTREKRLTDVMSLGLQLDSREAVLTRQSNLAAASLNAGKMTGNQVLSAFARAFALHLCGE